MPQFRTQELLEQLKSDVRQILLEAEKLRSADKAAIAQQPASGGWNIAQVLAHLNFYSHFYLSAIENKLHHHGTTGREVFSSGWFGNYFTNMMKPTDSGTVKNKMKALKSATPSDDINGHEQLDQFISDQHQLINLLDLARHADLGRIRVPTSLSKLIALKLGDTFRFFIAHEQRHFVQIGKLIEASKADTQKLEVQS